MKISLRLGLVISASVLITGLSVALVLSSWFYSSAVEEKRKWTASLIKSIAASISRDTLENKKSKVRTTLLEIQKQNPDIVYAYLTDFNGLDFVSTATAEMNVQHVLRSNDTYQHDLDYHQHDYLGKEIIDVGFPLIDNLPAHLHLGFSKSSIEGFIGGATGKLILLILVVLMLMVMLSGYIARKLSKPIVSLSKYVDAYGKGMVRGEDFNFIGHGKDEISRLYHSFVKMIEQRAWYEDELHEHRNNLEELVRQRTEELENVIHAHELAEVSLLEAKDIAEQASRAKTEFMSNMSHELRTPLNAVLGFAQLMKTENSDNKVFNLGVEQILIASNHLLELINDVLDLSGIEAGKVQIETETVDMKSLLDECIDMVSISMKMELPKITQKINFDDGLVYADKMRLKQVVINLLTNAVKYNRDNNDINIEIKALQDRLCMYVQDNGVGIPDSFKPQVFLPFNRLEKYVAVVEGTGIGLAISKRLVERMGGSIGFTSIEEEGSEFWICMPRSDVLLPTSRLDRLSDAESLMQGLVDRKFVILYIEDNPASMLLTKKLLEKYSNIELISALEPLVGIRLASERKPDLIFLDINMPGLNGYQVKAQLDNNDETREIPVVAISANAIHSDIEKALDMGFKKYLTKPVDIKMFYQVVYEYLSAVEISDI